MLIAGLDEAGRGPLAGPVVAAAVVYKSSYRNSLIKDSKQLSAASREKLSELIKKRSLAWAVVAVGHRRIESLNIRAASLLAMELALTRVCRLVSPDLVLVDGNASIRTVIPQKTVIHGDRLHVQISAASIIAKVWRDHLMGLLDMRYPGYGFGKHAGYPTRSHRAAIAELGPCCVHRRTFRGVREFVDDDYLPFEDPFALEKSDTLDVLPLFRAAGGESRG